MPLLNFYPTRFSMSHKKKKNDYFIKRSYFKKTKVNKNISSIVSGIIRVAVNSSLTGFSATGSGLLGIGMFFVKNATRGWVSASPVCAALIRSSTNVVLTGASFL
jgi:hypothetical protein